MKLLPILAIASSVILLSACGSNKKTPEPSSPSTPQVVADCTFPDAPNTAAPGWICDEPVASLAISATGSAETTQAGLDFQKQMAAANARLALAQVMQVSVNGLVKQYAETTGAASAETVDRVNSVVQKQLTSENLVGSRVFKSRTSPNKTLYVLVGFDEAAFKTATKNALKTSMKNDEAAWQQFRAEKGFNELAEEIAKMQ